jgi:hypothetical protein
VNCFTYHEGNARKNTYLYYLFQLLDAALNNPEQAKFLVRERVDNYRGFGGVGISTF